MAKRFYWLQLKEDFFRQKEIKLLRKIAGGDTYTIIYLKMMLMSLKDEGKILFEGVATTLAEEVALEIDEEVENVQITINFLLSKNLMSTSDFDGVMKDVPNLIGSESDSAKRVRKHREIKVKEQETLQCNSDVTSGNTEIDIELEKEKEIELEKEIKTDKNKEPEIEKITDKKQKELSSSSLFKYYESNGFGTLSHVIMESIDFWIEDITAKGSTVIEAEKLIEAAMKNAIFNNVRVWKYVNTTLVNWENQGLHTVEAVTANENQRSKSKSKGFNKEPIRKESLPEWAKDGYKPEKQERTWNESQDEDFMKLIGGQND